MESKRVYKMVKGFCASCGKEVGGFLNPPGFQCPGCKKVFCRDCSPERGFLIKKPYCPDCGVGLSR
jgi:predicted RNA-binding Zn-ribbon protein involved in translation (DUF1610 family)